MMHLKQYTEIMTATIHIVWIDQLLELSKMGIAHKFCQTDFCIYIVKIVDSSIH